MRSVILLLALLLPASALAGAETRYVKLEATIPLYAEPVAGAVVVKRLKPGDPVTLVSRQGEFANVMTAEGLEGWMLHTDTTTTAPLPRNTATLETSLAEQGRQLAERDRQITERDQRIAQLQSELSRAQANLRNTQSTLASASDTQASEIAALTEERNQLKAQLETRGKTLEAANQRIAELEQAQLANELLKKTPAVSQGSGGPLLTQNLWLLLVSGAVMLLLGVLAGYLLKSRAIRKRFHGMAL